MFILIKQTNKQTKKHPDCFTFWVTTRREWRQWWKNRPAGVGDWVRVIRRLVGESFGGDDLFYVLWWELQQVYRCVKTHWTIYQYKYYSLYYIYIYRQNIYAFYIMYILYLYAYKCICIVLFIEICMNIVISAEQIKIILKTKRQNWISLSISLKNYCLPH